MLTPTATSTPSFTPTCTFGPIVFPVATASPNPAQPGDIVTLDGSRSYGDSILSWAWTQLAGPSVNLSGADSASATFVAPVVSKSTTLTFQLFVHGSPGGRCDIPDGSVQITVAVRPSSCVGDCGGTLTLADTDIITLVNIVLGNASPSACPHGIPSGATVNVALIIQAVNNGLNGCPP
jgi:K319L-like, PKD domain